MGGSPNVLLGMPGLRQVRVFRCVDDVVFRHIIIARPAEWLDRRMLIECQNARKEEEYHQPTCPVPFSTL
jgi:hypothetical protein